MITVDRSGRANGVQIDPEMVVKSADPVMAIPQPEYHAPVRALLGEFAKRITTEIGVILFGSVARGTADRTSDIDLFVVVDGNRMETQREAHAIERDFADQRYDGDRYEAHIVVESKASAVTHDRLDEILTEGLTLRESPALDAVRQEVFADGTR